MGANVAELVFLGWSTPAPVAAAKALGQLALSRPPTPATKLGALDLSRVLVVVPSNRAGRVLRASLIDHATNLGRWLSPPIFSTPDRLAETLLPPLPTDLAANTTLLLAWSRALQAAAPGERDALLGSWLDDLPPPQQQPANARIPPQDPLTFACASLAESLAAQGLRLADVAESLHDHHDEQTSQRWHALAQLERSVESMLLKAGLHSNCSLIAHARTAIEGREDLLAHAGLDRVAVVSCPELTRPARAVLDGLSPAPTVLVAAPAEHREGFDPLGVVHRAYWHDRGIGLDRLEIIRADSPREQASHAVRRALQLAEANGDQPHSVSLACVEPRFAPALQLAAERIASQPVHSHAGVPFASTPWGTLLRSLLVLTSDPRPVRLLEALAHPLLCRACMNTGQSPAPWLGQYEQLLAERLPSSIDALARIVRDSDPQAAPAFDLALGLLQPWLVDRPAGFSHWLGELVLLADAADARTQAPADESISAPDLRALREFTSSHRSQIAHTALDTPMQADEALRLILHALAAHRCVAETERTAIETIGWLDLAMDPSPSTVIVGAHEQSLPVRSTPHGWLPQRLRQDLGLPSDDDRAARDAFLLAQAAHSRSCVLIAGSTDATGEPVLPSPLLLIGHDTHAAAARASVLLRDPEPAPNEGNSTATRCEHSVPGSTDAFAISRIVAPARSQTQHYRATSFADFIKSPVLFHDRHILNARELHLPRMGMDEGRFGSIVHAALAAAGPDAPRADLANPDRMLSLLRDRLHAEARARLDRLDHKAVAVQLRAAECRLGWLAPLLADRVEDGWMPVVIEAELRANFTHPALDTPFAVVGRVDRIEQHDDGRRAIIDFKTGEHRSPLGRDGAWIDLQLPLYQAMFAAHHADEPPTAAIAYVHRQAHSVTIREMEWQAGDVDLACQLACEIVRRVRAGEFDDAQAMERASTQHLSPKIASGTPTLSLVGSPIRLRSPAAVDASTGGKR